MTITDKAREAWKYTESWKGSTFSTPAQDTLADAIRSLTAQLMESEFMLKHRYCRWNGCVNSPEWHCEFGFDRERHNWTKEQWERAAEEELNK